MKVPAQDTARWRQVIWEQQRTGVYAGIDGGGVSTCLPPLPFPLLSFLPFPFPPLRSRAP